MRRVGEDGGEHSNSNRGFYERQSAASSLANGRDTPGQRSERFPTLKHQTNQRALLARSSRRDLSSQIRVHRELRPVFCLQYVEWQRNHRHCGRLHRSAHLFAVSTLQRVFTASIAHAVCLHGRTV